MAVKIQLRRDTAANWTSFNPTLASGEIGFETDTGRYKMGTGATAWNSQPYATYSIAELESFVGTEIAAAINALTTSDIEEGTNLYFTNARALSATSAAYDPAGSADLARTDAELYTYNELVAHNSDTTNVHGIADTSLLETQSGAQLKADGAQSAANLYTDNAVSALIESAPTALNTLNELAAALGDDPNFATTIANSVATKATLTIDTAANWTAGNAVLPANVFGLEADTGKFKIGNGVTTWTSLPYAATTSTEIATLTSTITTAYQQAISDAVTTHDRTFNVHGISDTTNLAYLDDVYSAIAAHSASTLGIHGISNTANLAYLDSPTFTGSVTLPQTIFIGDVSYSELSILNGATLSTAELNVLDGVTASTVEINTLDGILATTAELNTLSGVTATSGEINILDGAVVTTSELNTLSGVTATAGEINTLDGILATTAELNTLAGITASTAELNVVDGLLATTAELNTLAGITASTAELNTLDGVTSSALELNILDGATVTALELNVLDGILATTTELNTLSGLTATTTELNHISGSTSSIQGQLDTKAPLASPTFTGTVSGISKAMVGLGSVDNTADVNKPVSTAQQAALDLKADLAGDTFTGAVQISDTTASTSTTSGALIVSGGVGVAGSINSAGVAYFGDPTTLNLSNPVGFFTKDVNDYIQLGLQNTNAGAFASSDLVLTADNGTNTTHYIDIGIASSGYNYPDFGFIQPNDGYILVEGGDLALAASTGGKKIEFYIGGTLETDEVGSWTEAGLTIDQDLDVLGTITGNLTGNVTGNLSGIVTGSLVGDVTGNVSGNAGTVTNGVYTTDTATVTNTMLAGSIADTKLSTITTAGKVENSATTATASNTASTIVARDASGNFTANMITLAAVPTDNNHAATKSYVDNISAGIAFHEAVHLATEANLDATYNNGTGGVGATLTKNSNGEFTVDGSTALLNDRILVKTQTNPVHNGIYVVTTEGTVSTPAVLTRAVDSDNSPSGEISTGDFVFVETGTVNAGYGYINNSTASPIVVGTSDITYTQFSAGQSVLAGNGLTKTGSTVDIVSASSARIAVSADSIDLATVSQSDSSGTAGVSFVQSHSIDSYGRVTGTVTADVRDATTSAKGIASFASGTFSVTAGAVDVASAGVTNDMLAGSIADSKLSTISTAGKVANSATTATELNTASAIVARDASGNFTAGIITAALNGNADTATNATDATNANNVEVTEDVTTNGQKYLTWVDGSSGNNPVKTTSTKLTFNPSTGNLSATSFTATSISGNLTAASGGVTFSDGTVQATAGIPSISTFRPKTATYTVGSDVGLAERDNIITIDSTSAGTLYIPTDATTDFPIGTSFDVIRLNTGTLNIAAVTPGTTSVVATPGLNLRARYSSATCLKIGANSWIVYGDLAS